MKVLEFLEQEDGSAVLSVDLTADDMSVLLEYALQSILIKTAQSEIEKNARSKCGSSEGDVEAA